MSKLSLDVMQLLNLIKETGSFSTTAERLHRTPSAISYRVSSVEKQLGIKLFKRNGPIVELTRTGETIASEGEWILKAVDNLENSLNIQNKAAPLIKIGVSESFAVKKFSQYLCDFLNHYPDAKLIIQKIKNGDEWQQLMSHNIDIVISGNPCPSNMNVKTMPMGTNKLVCCATPEYLKAYREKSKKTGHEQENCIVISNSNFDSIVKYSIPCLRMNNRVIVDDMATQIDLIKSGCGFGIVPLFSIRELLNNNELKLANIENEIGYEMIWTGWTEDNKSRHVKWWVEVLKEICIH
ncbi:MULTISPECIES: LysR family transcriptional regulator [Cedecea]|nr:MULTISPECIES: LysR family transcriptional regulator [Cedecea]SMG61678.1 DNA-binding transcriptional regulator, LysR family [Cedecea sp. NFIX57]